jgi:hypothetical protein
MQADKEVDSLTSWDHVFRAYKAYSQCDDGGIAEGYSDAIGKLLANDWQHFNRLVTLVKSSAGFKRFVLRHINESLPRETLSRIANNARTACPNGGEALCHSIAVAAGK